MTPASLLSPRPMTGPGSTSAPQHTPAPIATSRQDAPRYLIRDERGAAAAVIVLLTVALFAVAGLVIDGGYALGAQRRAMNTAEQAARVGSDTLSQAALRCGQTHVDPDLAAAAVQDYLSQVAQTGTATVIGDEVTVTVTYRQETTLLAAVGITTIPVSATATAVSIDDTQAGN